MRRIESRILDAWHSKRACKLSIRDRLVVSQDGLRTYYLWDTPILRETETAFYLSHGGYHTRLTASRLNALQSVHGAGHCTLSHGSLYIGADLFDRGLIIPKKYSTLKKEQELSREKEQELFT